MLEGGTGNDVLFGENGRGTIDGGVGDDDLSGGLGADVYLIGWGMGRDTVADDAMEQNTLVLENGTTLSDLYAFRVGNDLRIRLKGTDDGLLLRDYFQSSNQWRLQDETGAVTSLDALLPALQRSSPRTVADYVQDYRERVRGLYFSTLAQAGYNEGVDGVWRLHSVQSGTNFLYSYDYEDRFTELTQAGDGETLTGLTNPYQRSSVLVSQEETTAQSAAVSGREGVPSGFDQSATFYSANGLLQGPIGPFPLGTTYVPVVNGNRYLGVWVVPPYSSYPYPGSLQLANSFVTRSYEIDSSMTLQWLVGGGSNNVLQGAPHSILDGGAGNDILATANTYSWEYNYGQSYSVGGTQFDRPYDERRIGALLIGNEGQDVVNGSGVADTLVGGQGDDYLAGGAGPDTYIVLGGDTGTDIITDQEVLYQDLETGWSRYKDWYGQTHGTLTGIPFLSPTDYARLEPLYDIGVLERDVVRFGPGVAIGDLALSWGTYGSGPGNMARTLDVTWGAGSTARIVMPPATPTVWTQLGNIVSGDPWLGESQGWDPYSRDSITSDLDLWFAIDSTIGAGIERFEFADGTTLSMADMLALAPIVPALDIGDQDNLLVTGTELSEVLGGADGADTINAMGGDDTLFGGAGNDLLLGGGGGDVYLFSLGGGQDQVVDVGGHDVVRMGWPIVPSDLVSRRDGFDLVIGVGSVGGDELRIRDWYAGAGSRVEAIEFGDGTIWDTAMIETVAGGESQNQSPVVSFRIVDHAAVEDAMLSLVLPASTFTDPDTGDMLTLSATLDDGGFLPPWLRFDAATGTFSGLPANGDVGIVAIKVTATDAGGLSVSDSFDLAVSNTNDAPLIGTPVLDQTAMEDTPFSFTVPSDTFVDVDLGDVVSYSAAVIYPAGGVPTTTANPWLHFEPMTRTLSGTPGNWDVGTATVTVTATDAAGATASDTFDITVQNVNDTPIASAQIADQVANEGGYFSYQAPPYSFYDLDVGDVLTYSATLSDGSPLPSWLGFDAATRTLSGAPTNADTGTLMISLVATDSGGLAAGRTFRVLVGHAIFGTNNSDALTGTTGADIIDGRYGNDSLNGDGGDDTILGGWGSDSLNGGAGDDVFLATGNDGAYDRFEGGDGFDIVQGSDGDDTIRLSYFAGAATVERIDAGTGTNVIAGTGWSDAIDLSGTELVNIGRIEGGDGNDAITGSAGDDLIIGGTGSDNLRGGAGNDLFLIGGVDGNAYDRFEGGDGFDIVQGSDGDDTIRLSYFAGAATVERIDAGTGTNVIAGTGWSDAIDLSGTELVNIGRIEGGDGNDAITGSAGDDLIIGGTGSDNLRGGYGMDILLGGDGADLLSVAASNGLLVGGAGVDVLKGAASNELLIGGTDNDTLDTGAGYDLIAFNRGDGVDTVAVSSGRDNTISLGGGIRNGDLAFRKSTNDLILDTGSGESIVLQGWYAATANKSVLTLQMIEDAAADFAPGGGDSLRDNKVEQFDFAGLADAFDQARAANPALTRWALSSALLAFHLGGSDTTAIGGDLAYQFGKNGSLANIGFGAAQSMLADGQWGQANQAINQPGLSDGLPKLSA